MAYAPSAYSISTSDHECTGGGRLSEEHADASAVPGAKPGNSTSRTASSTTINLLGVALLFLGCLLVYLFLCLWPGAIEKGADVNQVQEVMHLWGRVVFLQMTLDERLILTVMVAGALGSFVHVATSFGDFVGNEKLANNWIWWYILRPFVAMALAAIFYFVVRGGFLSAGSQADSLNIYGIVAVAGMVGMFSKQATDKLGEVFDTLFKTGQGAGDSARKDSLDNPSPTLTSAELTQPADNSPELMVTLKGAGFVKGSIVRVNGKSRRTEFVDSTRVRAELAPEERAAATPLELSVFNPPPGGGVSAVIKLSISEQRGMLVVGSPLAAAGDQDALVDGCDVEIISMTPDEELPAAKGGVA
jgi:hypothetical protein